MTNLFLGPKYLLTPSSWGSIWRFISLVLLPPRDNPTLQPTSGSSTTTMYSTGLRVLSQG